MNEYFSNISEKVQNHLKQLSGSIKFIENTEEPLEQLAKVWLEKEELFNKKLEKNDFEPVDTLSVDEERGALIMTYSGSLLSIGPAGEDGRKVEYSSVGFRTDVPDGLEQDGAVLEGDIEIGAPVKFKNGPLQQSSPVYKLALVKESLDDGEAEELLAEMTQMLSDEFVEINKTIIQD